MKTDSDFTANKHIRAIMGGPWEELRLLADTLPELIAFIDAQECHQFLNTRYREWFGAWHQRIQGKTVMDVVGDSVYARLKPHIEAALRGYNVSFETRMPHPKMGYRMMSVNYVTYTVEYGRVLGFYCLMSDITGVKGAGDKERSGVAGISHLQHAALSEGRLSDLAHSLKQPLGAITNYVAVLRRMLKDDLDREKADNVLDKVSSQTQAVDKMVNAAREAATAATTRRVALDLNKVLEKCLDRAEARIEEHKTQVRVDTSSNLPRVYASEVQMEELIINLIINALEAMKASRPERRQLTLQSDYDEKQVTLTVSDTGKGISAGELGLLLASRNTVNTGVRGLGLSICRSIVENYGGRLWVESKPGEGSSFHICLPLDERTSKR